MKLQNTDTTNRLNTVIQMARVIADPRPKAAASIPRSRAMSVLKWNSTQNRPRQAMNTRYTTGRNWRRGQRETSQP